MSTLTWWQCHSHLVLVQVAVLYFNQALHWAAKTDGDFNRQAFSTLATCQFVILLCFGSGGRPWLCNNGSMVSVLTPPVWLPHGPILSQAGEPGAQPWIEMQRPSQVSTAVPLLYCRTRAGCPRLLPCKDLTQTQTLWHYCTLTPPAPCTHTHTHTHTIKLLGSLY